MTPTHHHHSDAGTLLPKGAPVAGQHTHQTPSHPLPGNPLPQPVLDHTDPAADPDGGLTGLAWVVPAGELRLIVPSAVVGLGAG